MNKIFFLLIHLFCFALIGFGQSVVIVPKKITYTRTKPISEYNKNFTITYPIVQVGSTKLAKKIEASISYEKVMSFSVDNEINDSQWLEEAEYSVYYNQKGVLCIYLSFSGTGAYETFWGKYAVVDLKTGNRVFVKDVFKNLNGLAAMIRKIQKEEIEITTKEIKQAKDYGEVNTDDLFKYVDFKPINLENFSLNADGVIFQYHYGFPRIYYPLEPSGNYFISWKEIKPFIKRDGLLEKFIR